MRWMGWTVWDLRACPDYYLPYIAEMMKEGADGGQRD